MLLRPSELFRAIRERLPRACKKARLLRDVWTEELAKNPSLLSSNGKYEITRQIESSISPSTTKLLDAA